MPAKENPRSALRGFEKARIPDAVRDTQAN